MNKRIRNTDILELNYSEVMAIQKWNTENKDKKLTDTNIPFEELLVKVTTHIDTTRKVVGKVTDKGATLIEYMHYWTSGDSIHVDTYTEAGVLLFSNWVDGTGYHKRSKAIWLAPTDYPMSIIMNTLAYLTYRDVTVVPIQNRSLGNSGSKGKSSSRVVYMGKRYRVQDNGSDRSREYVRKTGSWTVRGHWREYKSGKRVWIKGHKRGTGELSPKTYRL